MTSNRPYLLRALYEWISDNHMTPHILVDAAVEGVNVPEQAVQKGKVILNIDGAAVRDLNLANDWLSFNARFSGRSHEVSVPVEAVLAIYAKENGQGMMFAQDDETPPPTDPDSGPGPAPEDDGSKRPHLKLVK
ncbi:ClpXP protease specificity-enhancing factor [Elongatibacter sediminis]|uniref:ClpXP protease specificity-enhancing factor n=1 Tax=Elongatibacter sediminis TaxID=3119006 RepID=A0AAW9REY3_9GAMM